MSSKKDNKKDNKKDKGFTVNDKRWWLNDDGVIDEASDSVKIAKPSYVEDLEQRLAEKEKTLTEYIKAHKSSLADIYGTRQRLEKEHDR